MDTDDGKELGLGIASGLLGGLIGAAAMTAFQSGLAQVGITSGVRGWPSTERAADRLALLSGRRLPARDRPAAGEAVHYAMGSLVGGVYGMAAELDPRVTCGRGAAFGVAAATLVDETLVPALRFGDPITRAPVQSHPYSYVSHLVYGAFTEAARKLCRRFFLRVRAGAEVVREARAQKTPVAAPRPVESRRTLTLAFLLGATAGPRTSAPLATTAWAARLGWLDLSGSPLACLASTRAVALTTPMAIGELIVDKLPSTPDRTEPVGVVARAASGAISGAALAGGRSWRAALAGAAGAVAATYLGHTLRDRLSHALGRDFPVAAVEDLIAFGGATMVQLAALAPDQAGAETPSGTAAAQSRPSGRRAGP